MGLTTRLQMVADCVTPGSRIADVGCDHAYISIDLTGRGIAVHSVAMDINQGPLARAQENILSYGLADKIEIRLSDGLNKLLPGEADSIIIAGMGGALTVKILSEGAECAAKARELILQPQSELCKVRRYLHSAGFRIISENMCLDSGKYYVVMKAVLWEKDRKPHGTVQQSESCCLENRIFEKYGEYLIIHRHPVLKEFLLHKKEGIKQLISGLSGGATPKAKMRQKECLQELEEIREALTWFDKGEDR